ncbi:hypothetical protein DES47_105247 [Roseateles toxinivorans]|uniref:TIGR04255 family protein n=2 Tax=Roseateles toxinivorans TaxID=270368 RepID=A0A4R6QK13_9BURK|nr:hypothetical protein DES47_105247 [Roseateles toxinivorans]
MAIVRKFTIGVQPFAKMFRVYGKGGEVVDAVLRLRTKGLHDDFFSEVVVSNDRTAFRLSSEDQLNSLQLTDENFTFTKDYYEANTSFDFKKVLDEFRLIWSAVNAVLNIQDVRRIGMVAEYRYSAETKSASGWLREKLTKLETQLLTEKFQLRFEERAPASDGLAPDPKKADFINYIYNFYDASMDASHPSPGSIDVNLDVQRYFAPVINSSVPDEILKLHKHFEKAEGHLDDKVKAFGAMSHGKK